MRQARLGVFEDSDVRREQLSPPKPLLQLAPVGLELLRGIANARQGGQRQQAIGAVLLLEPTDYPLITPTASASRDSVACSCDGTIK